MSAEPDLITVRRWTDETGRRTRRWYWEARFAGSVIGAGFLGGGRPAPTEAEVWQHAARALAEAAYVRGLTDAELPARRAEEPPRAD